MAFADLYDDGWKIQLVLRRNVLGRGRFKWFLKYIDRGDVIEASGTVFYTKKGELSIDVKGYRLLAKSLRSPPGKYGHGVRDPEVRYRKRYLDIMMSPRSRRIFEVKFRAIQAIREFLWSRGFIEVETPVIQPIYGGAAARPFTTHVWAIDEDWYLRISPELYLKRYIIAGFNRVFEIGKQFRNEDIDVRHNPEFTTIEVYQAYADYNDIMELTEEMIAYVVKKVLGTLKVKFPASPEEELKPEEERRYYEIDFTPPWRRITFKEALRKYAEIDADAISDEEIQEKLKELGVSLPGGYCRGLALAKLFDKLVEKHLIQPTFVLDYPRETTPLCKLHRRDPSLIERFELYVAGMELANAYTELNDPLLQRKFFEEEEERMRRGDEEAHPYDWDFVEALEYGMPPTGGLGLGIDRLVMVMVGTYSIKEVIPFPILKRGARVGEEAG